MRKFIINSIIVAFILLLGSACFLRVLVSFPNHYSQLSYDGVGTMRQIERIKKLKEPKVVIIGGSNCCFGLCSPLINKHFGMPVCNTGVNYSFGLQMQIKLYEEYVKSGDLVVVIPEYHQYMDDFYLGNNEILQMLTSVYPQGYKLFTVRQQLHLLPYVPKSFRLACMMKDVSPKGVYSKNSLNEYGDVEMYDIRYHLDTLDWTPEDWREPSVQKRTVQLLQDFNRHCESRGAIMLLFPPVFNASNFDTNETYIHKIWKTLETRELMLASFPERYRLPDTLFYDSPYHLTYEGVLIRTNRLIEDMDSALRIFNNVRP